MTALIAFYRKAAKAVHAQAALLGTWCAAVLPTHRITRWDLLGLGLALLGGPVVWATTNGAGGDEGAVDPGSLALGLFVGLAVGYAVLIHR